MKFNRIGTKSKSDGSSTYLSIKDGESVTIILRGEVHTFYTVWQEGKSERVGPGTYGAKPRFSVNAIVKENGKFIPKVWDFGIAVNNQLADIAEVCPITETKLRVLRKGTRLDTEYSIIPLPEKLSPMDLNEISALALNILNREEKPEAPIQEDDGPNWAPF